MSEAFDSKAFLKTVTSQPGVYRMYDAGGTVIYVGKAKDLKKRLSSYFRSNLASRKTEALVALIHNIDVTVTHTARSRTVMPCGKRWRFCKKSFLFASAKIAFIATAPGHACNIRLAAAWGRALKGW